MALLGKGGALSGTLQIEARDIHIAAGSLLTRLAADPFFASAELALDRESAGGTDPVIRAGALDLAIGRSFYIQRSGTGFDPLGFEEPLGGITLRSAAAAPITVIINGTFRTAAGLVSGAEAWRQFKASGVNLSGFTADSRLNGCLLSAAVCGLNLVKGEPDPGLPGRIKTTSNPDIGDTPDDPDKHKPGSPNAIQPLQVLLPVQSDALAGAVDEGIAGSGNPALVNGGSSRP